ncbi:MAG TPA: transglutaminase domain-containing protein [Pyrinomonadaceae bacterium]|jgi:Flp pilus assembly protein TadD
MRKVLLPLFFLLCLGSLFSANAQPGRLQAREAEWKNYALPQTNFTRKLDADKIFIFRVPADWQQDGDGLTFNGPHSASLKIVVQKIPEGYPLDDYFGATVRTVKDLSGGVDFMVTRKTQFQNVEARELVVEVPDPEGELIRSTTWIATYGPQAIIFNLKVPAPHAAEVEPFFKAVVQSVIFVSYDYAEFEKLRDAAIKSPSAAPINEIENIIESLNETTAARESAVTRLASLFSSTPEAALDLLLDRRAMVRVAAVQAATQSKNGLLTPFLWELLDDREPLVSEAAARSVAASADVVPKVLEHSMSGFRTEMLARVWPFLSKEKRNELLEIIFKETAARPEPPPAVKAPPKTGVSVSIIETAPVRRGKSAPELVVASSVALDPNVQIGALTLLIGVPVDEFKLPLARIMASNYDPLIAVGLQVALFRGEALPLAPLLKLISSSNKQVSNLAARSLATAASTADIPQIEALISKDGSRKERDDDLKLTVRKINFRNALRAAKTEEEKRATISKAIDDTALADFAWLHDCEATTSGCASSAGTLATKRDLTIKPFAENLFPKRVRHYTAIPNPRQAVQKFYETLQGLQMDTPRAQAGLVFMLTNMRKLLGETLTAPVDANELIDYTGIDPDAPIASGSWTAQNAPDNIEIAQRNAIVLRVKDRGRFERTVDNFQRTATGFTRLTDIVGVGSRAIAALPAVLPMSAKLALSTDRPKTSDGPLLRYSFSGDKEWNGLKLRTFRTMYVGSGWDIAADTTYIAYVGDTAILAPDLASIRDLLARASTTEGQFLADNSEFRKALDTHGDVVYCSDLKAIFATPGDKKNTPVAKTDEYGALKFSASSWETSHHVTFDESDWSKPLLPFQPKDMTAARELLPSSTIAYYLMAIDFPALWSNQGNDLLSPSELETLPKLWVPNFKQEVLPELGPECGIVVTEMPDMLTFTGGTWAAFCKLKSSKLSDALIAGKLLLGVGPTTDVAELKRDSDSYFVAARRGYLIVTNNAKGLAAFDGKTNLAATRDYSRSIEKVPGSVIAFGGYNLPAAVAAATKGVDEGRQALIASRLFEIASAFHSQNFYATATGGSIEAHSSVAMDREGRYPVADFSSLPRGTGITYAIVEPRGVPITDQNRLSSLVLRVHAKAPGPIDNIKDDIKSATQAVEQKSATELRLTVAARRAGTEKSVQLPVKDPEFGPYLKATSEFAADKKEVIDKAREIAGKDRDAWNVALKLAEWTNKNLEWKLVVSADPVQTLATREADCSEFSALFVAMARSLGLPARTVSGLAYTGTTFGAHAWVEVWAGRWIELDPTFGTSFVDATHIRDTNNALVTSVALNLIDLEVLEANRSTAEFQKSPRALAEHLAKAIPAGDKSEIEATIDLATLTDEHMGAGAWAKLSDGEREQMWSAYRRIVTELLAYGKDSFGERHIRVVHLEEKGDTAEAICLTSPVELMLRLRLLRRNDVWHLSELVLVDDHFATVSEMLQPAIGAIEKARAGEKPPAIGSTGFVRVLLLLSKDAAKAARLADELLKSKPKDTGLRYLKALALLDGKTAAEGVKLLTELSDENFAPAVYKLAQTFSESEDEAEWDKAIPLYERYISLEPHDPRGFRDLGHAYDDADRSGQAEAAYRKALEIDPADLDNHSNLIELLVLHDQFAGLRALLVAGEKYQQADDDLFGSVIQDLCLSEETKAAEKLAASEPLRMKTSARANLSLGRVFTTDGRYVEARRLLTTAAQLEMKSAEPHVQLAKLFRKQSQWPAALKAADRAISLEPDYTEGYYERACALARLRRFKEAIVALTKSVELDDMQVEYLADEEDLKPLASLPEFKKLLPPPPTKEQP